MGSETRVCPGLIGWVVVEEFVGIMYFFGLNHYIIVIDLNNYQPPSKFVGRKIGSIPILLHVRTNY